MHNAGDLRKPAADAILSPQQLRGFFYDLYADAPRLLRVLSACRPYVCPFDSIVRFVPEGAKVFDFGCGTGAVLSLLSAIDRVERGVGCDVSEFAIQVARVAAHRLGTDRLQFRKINDWSEFPHEQFDCVLMVDVLHHISPEKRSEAIRVATGLTAPGGLFIYKDMTDKPRWRRWAHTIDDLIFSQELVEQVPPAFVETWGGQSGLELVHADYLPRLVYGNVLRVFRRPRLDNADRSSSSGGVSGN